MLGVIGGSGLYSLESLGAFRVTTRQTDATAWGQPSAAVVLAATSGGQAPGGGSSRLGDGGAELAFLARHGETHSIAPHLINYRANIGALRSAGVTRVLSVASVGGIGPDCMPGTLVVPDQLIDYTWGREQTFAGREDPVIHTDFTNPYSPSWRERVITTLRQLEATYEASEAEEARPGEPATLDAPAKPEERFKLVDTGTYAAVTGPRFETAAEISRLARDSCTVVGMTGMPEAVLAREAGLEYAAVCPVGNLAAGIGTGELTMAEVVAAVRPAGPLLAALIAALA